MNDSLKRGFQLPPEQQAIRDKCFHPSGTFVEFPMEDVETSIPARFENIVRMYPNRIAVEMDDQRVTYEALNRAANRLANFILANSDGNVPVAVMLPQGDSQAVAILAVLKAGKILLLQDPKTPLHDLAHFLADSQVKLIITSKDHESDLRYWEKKGLQLVDVDGSNSGFSNQNLGVWITPDTGAYIKYTSGSTGRAKGAVINHRTVLQGVMIDTNPRHFCSDDRLVQVNSNNINRPFFTNLLNGATLCPLDFRKVGIHQLASWLKRHEITIYRAFPSAFRLFVGLLSGREYFPRLRLISMAGEPLYRSDVDLFKKYFSPDCLLSNTYASTETGTICSYYVDKSTEIIGKYVPVGYPVRGKEVSIVDDEGNDLPVNQPGEIVVKSRFLSAGYWQRGEEIENNFQSSRIDPESRIYYTGDIGQLSADGCLTHLGRKDGRVKIRNFRVDIGEVEATLAEHPEVKLTSVIAKEDFSGDTRLIAYFVSRNELSPTVTGLRKFLSAKLPVYMVPSAFVELSELPLTGTGKVNRRALPDPGKSRPNLETPLVEPTTEVEDKLAAIWMKMLSLDEVGIHDNFFDLGGNSLVASRVISHAIQTFQLTLPAKALFDAPTVSKMAAIITQNQTKQASELQQKQTEGTTGVTISRRSTQAVVPLSFAQQRLWFLSQLEPESCTYNETSALRLDGELNINALHGALNAIVERHEVLRTTYALADDGAPMQIVNTVGAVNLPVLDISELAGSQQDAQVRRLASELKTRPFDLSHDWPLRLELIRLSPTSHVLVSVKHHIASDGWSSGVFFRELTTLYQRLNQGETTPLPGLPIQYADYAVWQREWLQGEVLERQLAYWKVQLDDVPMLNLPTDRSRGASAKHSAAKKTLRLPKTLIDRLKALGNQQGATLFMTLLAAFQVLLHRYTGQDDIAVGSPIAGRTRAETEGLIGFFVNTLVYRNNLCGDPSFRKYLANVRDGALKAYEHQDLPFEKLVEELNPERSLTHSPVFQVLFAVQNVPRQKLEIPGLTATPLEIVSITAKFDLFAAFVERDRQLVLRLEYNADLFNAGTIERMAAHFQTLLESIVANPDQRIGQLALLTEAERRQVLIEWNYTGREIAPPRNVVEMFERQVELSPDAIAVVFESSRLTYQELNQQANQLAHYLIRHGVHAEDHVAVCLERSLELAIGFLAILKAGGVYAPLDPSYPAERLSLMVQDLQAPLVVTVQSLTSRFSSPAERLIVLESDQQGIAREEISNPPLAVSPDQPAYLLYTSGSTGRPKGVVMEHRALANLISWQVGSFGAPLAVRTLQFASLGFDVSIQEMFATWCSGGTLIFVDEELRPDGLRLLQFLDEHSVERIFLPFVALQHLADAAADGNCYPQSLREVITAGEQLQLTALLRSFLNKLGDCCLRNQYGPTESHVVTDFTLRPPFNDWPDLPPIGRPIANTETYILDSYLNPVPIGVAGEIYIGGHGLARGYLNQPELTAEKFITHSLDGESAKRLYKTGDLARYLPDGNIEFLGRRDTQVKIRGYRIELGEIETALVQHSSIRESVILAREDSPGDRRLVAYVVSAPSCAPSTNELRTFLQQKLPEYMVPSVFMFLESLPVTPNGKVDRRALPAPYPSRPELDETFADPRTPTEELLANIWMEVLKLDKVGIHDNFFDLGGHSLLATQVMSRLTKVFQTKLPLRSLFEAPTVAGLAERIEESRCGEIGSPVLPLVSMPRSEDIPLSFAQQRLWFLDRLEPNSPTYNIPSARRLKGPLDFDALEQSLNEIVRRHEALRTTFSILEGQPVQRISASLSLALSVIDLSQLPESQREDEARRLTNEEAQRPFDLERGPLVRSVLLHLGSEDHILLLTLHHIAADGWSMGIVHGELSALYQAFSNAKGSPLATLPVQYADFGRWQREWLQGDLLATQLGYWKKRLENIQTLHLPTDQPRPTIPSLRGARQSVELSTELTQGLKTLSRKAGVTLYMTLLAAFQTLLHRYTGQNDIVVGSPIANRNRIEIEGLIGFFVNTLVLRTDHSGNPTFCELLHQVRETALEAHAHQDLPFEKLVEELRPDRDFSRSPLFQAMFVYQNAPVKELSFEGLTVTPIKIAGEIAKFDLTLSVNETRAGLRASLQYNVDLFDGATIARMLGHFQNLLEGIVANPELRICELPLLTEPEKHQLLVEWNDTKRGYPSDKCIHQLFEEQVERAPEAIAVVFEEQQLTYRELNTRANQLAHHLMKLGVGPDLRVGICVERSIEMIVGLLAILKAGGAYVPLDPSYPGERLAFMLQDAQVHVLIAQQKFLSSIDHRTVVCLDRDWQEIAKENVDSPQIQSTTEAVAYVIYTSGSTGTPKGTLITHYNVVRLFQATEAWFRFDSSDVWTLFHSYAFDFSVWEMWGALLYGGKLVIVPHAISRSPQEFAALLIQQRVTVLNQTPSVFRQLIPDLTGSTAKGPIVLRFVIFGGEALELQSLKPWFECYGDDKPKLINMYGITETTVHVTYRPINRADLDSATGSVIGKPIPDLRVYLLDKHKALVPIGVAGEIYVGGAGVAKGYLGLNELTAERFVTDPFSDDSQAKLYRSGDLARWLPDGDLEYLGRIDDQIKVRGFRIELGEIEAVLSQHPTVQSSVVVVREDEPGDKRLVGYVVARPEKTFDASEVRQYLKQKLPEYMIPAALVLLDGLPLTPSGKVDRRALPAPDQNGLQLANVYQPPRTATEETLAAIWGEVLKLDKVGIYDNFFDLGGHSLLATQVVSRMRDAFSIDLPLRRMFESPTIAEMADVIMQSQWN